MKTARISLSNILLIASVLMVIVNASYAAVGVVFMMVLHANAKRLSAFKRKEQANAQIKQSEASEARLARLEADMKQVAGAVSMTKLGSR
ncbi:hypothetical protein EON64_08560 [archaeon]|nr:MAG: hypothetical protein EON64_08560 [archaeon]